MLYPFTFQEFNAILDIVENKTGLAFYYNYLLSKQPSEFDNYPKLLQKAEVRKAIHVGNLTYDDISLVVHEYLNDDIPKSIKPWLEELLEHYKVLRYYWMIYSYVNQIPITNMLSTSRVFSSFISCISGDVNSYSLKYLEGETISQIE